MREIKYAYLETTNYCNLRCSFCNRLDVIGPLKHMSLENWEILLNKIKHHPLQTAKLMGMGEPFLHPQFDEVTQKFKEYFPKTFVIVATNCQYSIKFDSSMRKKFESALNNIDLLYLSIDGFEDNYERDRSPAKWEKLIDFLENLQSVNRNKCQIVVNYVVNKCNIYDIPKIEELRKKYNLEKLRLNIAQIWSEDKSITDFEKIYGYEEKDIQYLKDNWQKNIMGKKDWEFKDCFWVKEGLYTTVEGNIKVCCLNTSAVPIGNIFTDNLEDVFSSKKFTDIKNGCLSNNPTDHCKKCSYKELTPILKKLEVNND